MKKQCGGKKMPAVNYLTYVKHRKALEDIRDIVIDALDGEPTTADEYNYEHDQLNEADEYNKEELTNMLDDKEGYLNEDTMKIYQFGGDTGIDADYNEKYYDENSEKYYEVKQINLSEDK